MPIDMPQILIVDDEPVSLMLLDTILSRSNFSVTTAISGEDALALLENNSFDLMILDLLMPDIDGMTVLQQLRENPKFENLPIIVFTAISQQRVQQEAYQKGATTFLTKPVSSRELTRVVSKFLQTPA
jgi:CheY-like chemotaxis protein